MMIQMIQKSIHSVPSPCAATLSWWRGLRASMILRAMLEGAYGSW